MKHEAEEAGPVSENFQILSAFSIVEAGGPSCHDRRGSRRTEQGCNSPYLVGGGYFMDRTTRAVQQQIAAMGTQVFEVGLFKPSAAEEGRAVMIPRIWDSATLIRSIPWLRMQNADGRNIYVRPKGEHALSLVDDLSADAVKRMKATGFTPAAVVETSPGNFQAWLKHPHKLPREISTMAARTLADAFGGDRGAADWRHFGRLAGFTNRKAKYMNERGLFPFVRLIDAPGIQYHEGERFAAAVSAQRDVDLRIREGQRRSMATAPRNPLKSIDEFRSNPRYGGDATRVDLAFAIYALSHGSSSDQVATALRSRDLSHKGEERRQNQYVDRTITKALNRTESRCLR
jgi:hypothetical protein